MKPIKLIEKTICDSLQEQVNHAPDRLALKFEDIEFTWMDLDVLSDNLAVEFMRKGIEKGTHIGIWSDNTPNWIINFFAILKLGAIPILINNCYTEHELQRLLEYADIDFLCYGDMSGACYYEKVVKTLIQYKYLKENNCIHIGKDFNGNWSGLKEKIVKASSEELDKLNEKKKNISPFDTAAIFFTSGTTNIPKGVMLSHYSLYNNSLEITKRMKWSHEDRMCIAVPLFHCFGITASLLAAIHAGCSMYLLNKCKSLEVLKSVHKEKCTILNGVPTMFLAMLHKEEKDKYTMPDLKSGIIAGSPISTKDYLKLCKTFDIPYLQPSYGQTETSPCITISSYDDPLDIKSKSVGKAIDHVLVRIYDNKSKKVLPHGSIGEIQTKGYHVMQGYYKLPEETKNTINEDGWLSTGDIGYMDEEGYLYITGRMSDMIIRGGENISPLEIEECILDYSDIKSVKVMGIKADVLQEEIVACIIPEVDKEIDVNKMKEFLRDRLASYKIPKYILFFEEFPYTASGKINLKKLRKQITDRLIQG